MAPTTPFQNVKRPELLRMSGRELREIVAQGGRTAIVRDAKAEQARRKANQTAAKAK